MYIQLGYWLQWLLNLIPFNLIPSFIWQLQLFTNHVGIIYVQCKVFVFVLRLANHKFSYISSNIYRPVMLHVKGAHEWYTHDSYYLLHVMLDYPHKNLFYSCVISEWHEDSLPSGINLPGGRAHFLKIFCQFLTFLLFLLKTSKVHMCLLPKCGDALKSISAAKDQSFERQSSWWRCLFC